MNHTPISKPQYLLEHIPIHAIHIVLQQVKHSSRYAHLRQATKQRAKLDRLGVTEGAEFRTV